MSSTWVVNDILEVEIYYDCATSVSEFPMYGYDYDERYDDPNWVCEVYNDCYEELPKKDIVEKLIDVVSQLFRKDYRKHTVHKLRWLFFKYSAIYMFKYHTGKLAPEYYEDNKLPPECEEFIKNL
ncbi:hypothetical protein Murmansk-033 [Murmansk poxvirus]|uniref:Uncharacterized protein n=1 Tax=Murmansk poxvirus TaxID=2025359 RepID=A0A223FML9_9POXV|nr:hypothetical protein CKM52_gp033 [Murmansk poxvirus]AST09228.1 hypothetical protein Murmansk-033 [Murmansk poxvirus]